MSKTVKYIILAIVFLVVVALFVFNDNVSVGGIIAAVSAAFAAFKSKLFNDKTLEERVQVIHDEHAVKREEWNRVQDEYESRFRAMKARMDYLDYRSAKITDQINDLDEAEKTELQKNNSLSDDEILERLNNL